MSSRPRPLIAAIGLTALASMALGAAPAPVPDAHDKVHAQLSKAYKATTKYHSEKKAIKDGYMRTDECAASPEGGMGYHYINLDHIDSLDPAKPAALLYEDDKHGKRRLVGVEYLVVDDDQDLATDDDRPTLFGQEFAGPMEGHGPGMPIHYDLHVWLHKHNPSGLFAEWNPTVKCPAPVD
ncbi:hypothetical protein U9R90_30865 [Streptomyces sp. E11-3]|uniref:hypothetical protein n=1 Tax=Streptomyces sp. E11-3 TaxID=3110112 RepID=UPI00398009E2